MKNSELPADPFATTCSEIPSWTDGDSASPAFALEYPLRILVAESNYTNRQVLLAMLRALGYVPIAFDTGPECLTTALLGDFDLLLDDLDLSDMDGVGCTGKIREAGIPLSIIGLLTAGDTAHEDNLDSLDGVLARPVSLGALQRTLRQAALIRMAMERE